MHFNERIAIVDGIRSPFVKSWSTLNGIDPVTLSTHVTRELLFSVGLDIEKIDQIVWGTVVSVPRSPNVAREVALNLGFNTPVLRFHVPVHLVFNRLPPQQNHCGWVMPILLSLVE